MRTSRGRRPSKASIPPDNRPCPQPERQSDPAKSGNLSPTNTVPASHGKALRLRNRKAKGTIKSSKQNGRQLSATPTITHNLALRQLERIRSVYQHSRMVKCPQGRHRMGNVARTGSLEGGMHGELRASHIHCV